jgi:AraC-like DNA-binding protein
MLMCMVSDSAPDAPSAQPLILHGPYGLRIDGAGGGATTRVEHARKSICNYLLTAFWDDEWQVASGGERRVLRGQGLFLIEPERTFSVSMAGGGRLRWIHFSVRWDPAWERFDHRLNFQIDKGRDEYVQPGSAAVWGIDLPPWAPAARVGRYLGWVEDIIELWLSGDAADRVEANLILAQLVHDWVRHQVAGQKPALTGEVADRLSRAERYARRRNGVDVDVVQLAREAGYTRSHFSAIFQASRGQSPGAFLRGLRMQEAATILRNQDLPVRVVGELVGHPNASAFARSFRLHFGMSPERYRAQGAG